MALTTCKYAVHGACAAASTASSQLPSGETHHSAFTLRCTWRDRGHHRRWATCCSSRHGHGSCSVAVYTAWTRYAVENTRFLAVVALAHLSCHRPVADLLTICFLFAGNSTWTETEGWARPGQDVLYQLGKQSSSMNIDMGAKKGIIDDLFLSKGDGSFSMGVQSDIASGILRSEELRSFAHLVGDYYVPPRFMEAVTMHLVKNFLAEQGMLTGVPLVLGIWGPKGVGKSFNVELACKALNCAAVVLSAGELEDEYAGEPGRRIRERYRVASSNIRTSGVLSTLVINDLDAGAGRFKDTQVTVNQQIVMGTLMNLCDHPQRASLGEEWRSDKELRRVPIIITGNDLSTLYAPLLRDGRMTKFLWEPTREDVCHMVHAVFADDGLSMADVGVLVDAFPGQPLDFFGALRARRYDSTILSWVAENGYPQSQKEVNRRLLAAIRDENLGEDKAKDLLPDFAAAQTATLPMLLATGRDLVEEQERVLENRLSEQYMRVMKTPEFGAAGLGFSG